MTLSCGMIRHQEKSAKKGIVYDCRWRWQRIRPCRMRMLLTPYVNNRPSGQFVSLMQAAALRGRQRYGPFEAVNVIAFPFARSSVIIQFFPLMHHVCPMHPLRQLRQWPCMTAQIVYCSGVLRAPIGSHIVAGHLRWAFNKCALPQILILDSTASLHLIPQCFCKACG